MNENQRGDFLSSLIEGFEKYNKLLEENLEGIRRISSGSHVFDRSLPSFHTPRHFFELPDDWEYKKCNDMSDAIAQATCYYDKLLRNKIRIEKPYGYLFRIKEDYVNNG